MNTSTGGAIYGEGRMIPAPEDHPVAPEAPYGQSKFAAEGYCDLFRRLHGLSTVSLRYGNVYGPRQDPLGEAGVIAIFCGKLLDGGQPDGVRRRPPDARLRLRGRRRGGQPARPRSPTRRRRSTSAPGSQTTVLDLVEALAAHADGPFEAEHGARAARRGAPHRARRLARARAELGWGAQVSARRASSRRSPRCAEKDRRSGIRHHRPPSSWA